MKKNTILTFLAGLSLGSILLGIPFMLVYRENSLIRADGAIADAREYVASAKLKTTTEKIAHQDLLTFCKEHGSDVGCRDFRRVMSEELREWYQRGRMECIQKKITIWGSNCDAGPDNLSQACTRLCYKGTLRNDDGHPGREDMRRLCSYYCQAVDLFK